MKSLKYLTRIGLAAVVIALSGCAGMTTQDQATIGGAVAGGVIGNAVTGGGALGTAAGAAAGGIIGHEVTRPSYRDRRY
jgi:osmotically inducible lipoprotein OsmB